MLGPMKNILARTASAVFFSIVFLFAGATFAAPSPLEPIHLSPDGAHFARAKSGKPFVAWGFNYDHDRSGRLLEDYWEREWATVAQDFQEMKALGANVVRIHLQTGKFMATPTQPNADALRQLTRLVKLAEDTGLYLDLTGLACYHKRDIPTWYGTMAETNRWAVQARFWEAVAATCQESPAVFCYDLMNEPILPGAKKKETEWLTGELDGKCFVQRLTLDLAGRTREAVARAWVDQMVGAIRQHDPRHLITVGEIPFILEFHGGKPFFASKEVGEKLDFASVHFYPQKGEVDWALEALGKYKSGKPLVVEELFPLKCSTDELGQFIDRSRPVADGWIGFYWGETIDEYATDKPDIGKAITKEWLKFFRAKAEEIRKH